MSYANREFLILYWLNEMNLAIKEITFCQLLRGGGSFLIKSNEEKKELLRSKYIVCFFWSISHKMGKRLISTSRCLNLTLFKYYIQNEFMYPTQYGMVIFSHLVIILKSGNKVYM